MKDLPMFTTEYGAASLVLREVPYQETAYIRLQHSLEPEKLLAECVSFCRMVGAERIYATGHECLQAYPLHTAILRLHCLKDSLGDTDAALWPVQQHTVAKFREIYNQKASRIPNAAWMTASEEQQLVTSGKGYFVHRGDTLLGIGIVEAGQIRFLAAVEPGAGADVVKALAHGVTEDTLTVDVASTNAKAMALYQRLGFLPVEELSRWYDVLEK